MNINAIDRCTFQGTIGTNWIDHSPHCSPLLTALSIPLHHHWKIAIYSEGKSTILWLSESKGQTGMGWYGSKLSHPVIWGHAAQALPGLFPMRPKAGISPGLEEGTIFRVRNPPHFGVIKPRCPFTGSVDFLIQAMLKDFSPGMAETTSKWEVEPIPQGMF